MPQNIKRIICNAWLIVTLLAAFVLVVGGHYFGLWEAVGSAAAVVVIFPFVNVWDPLHLYRRASVRWGTKDTLVRVIYATDEYYRVGQLSIDGAMGLQNEVFPKYFKKSDVKLIDDFSKGTGEKTGTVEKSGPPLRTGDWHDTYGESKE